MRLSLFLAFRHLSIFSVLNFPVEMSLKVLIFKFPQYWGLTFLQMFLIWNLCAQTKKFDMKRLILCDILINCVKNMVKLE